MDTPPTEPSPAEQAARLLSLRFQREALRRHRRSAYLAELRSTAAAGHALACEAMSPDQVAALLAKHGLVMDQKGEVVLAEDAASA